MASNARRPPTGGPTAGRLSSDDPYLSHWRHPLSLAPDIVATLETVTTATISTMLLKKGIRHCWMKGAMPFSGQTGKRIVGPAFTLRFVPVREDLATPASWAAPISTREAIEAMPQGCIAVADAMGVTTAGIFGDILCM